MRVYKKYTFVYVWIFITVIIMINVLFYFTEIHVELRRGMPTVTVPLPSRRELCQFTLRPVTNTVGDFTNMLKTEDQGVDRVVVSSSEGVRIASSTTIESLMEENFRLTINDRVFTVNVPPHKKLTKVCSLKIFNTIFYTITRIYSSYTSPKILIINSTG